MMDSAGNRILMVDGMALLFRAYYASAVTGYIKRTSDGVPVNAVYGFMRYFLDAVKTFSPTHVVCCWDMGSKTFRSEKFVEYKANRSEPPLEMLPQFDMVKDVVSAFNIPNIGLHGYEADDCIGTLADLFAEEMEVYVLTGDHDLLQLVSEQVKVVIMKKGYSNYAVYDLDMLLQERFLTPAQIVDLKGLTGDTSDNYPGVRGIGEKTAVKLLLEHQSIDGILANLANLPKGVRAKIENDLDMLHLCRELATIERSVPIECTLASCQWTPDFDLVRDKFEELEFKGLLKEIG